MAAFDTLTFVERLEAAGMERKIAEALVEALQQNGVFDVRDGTAHKSAEGLDDAVDAMVRTLSIRGLWGLVVMFVALFGVIAAALIAWKH